MTAKITNFVLDSRSKRRVEFLKWKVKNTFRVLMFYYYYFFLNAIKHYSRAYLARLEKYNNNVHHQFIISITVHTKLRDPARSTSSCVRTTDGGGSDNHLGVHIISIGNTIL